MQDPPESRTTQLVCKSQNIQYLIPLKRNQINIDLYWIPITNHLHFFHYLLVVINS